MTKKTKEIDLMDLQGDAMDIAKEVEGLAEDISSAESCETIDDFRANLENALAAAKSIQTEVQDLLKRLA